MKQFKLVISAFAAVAIYIILMFSQPAAVDNTNKPVMPEENPIKVEADEKEVLAPNGYINAFVKRIVDGDTIEVVYLNKKYKVRLLCVDTPESVKQGVETQPFGKEASEEVKDMVLNKNVKLVFEEDIKDRYGRLLAYVIMENGDNLNAILVRNGFARVEIVNPNHNYEEYFYMLQEKAIDEKAGFWGLSYDQQPFVKNEKGKYVPRYWQEKKAS